MVFEIDDGADRCAARCSLDNASADLEVRLRAQPATTPTECTEPGSRLAYANRTVDQRGDLILLVSADQAAGFLAILKQN